VWVVCKNISDFVEFNDVVCRFWFGGLTVRWWPALGLATNMVITLVILLLGLSAWVAQTLLTLQTHESRRYARSRLRLASCSLENEASRPVEGYSNSASAETDDALQPGLVTLIVPCKGFDLDGEQNLIAFLQQDHPNFEIVFVVESEDDPAHALIQRVRRQFSQVSSRIVVAGRCVESAQKVHNLVTATGQLPAETTTLAFADSDACPPQMWLSNLVARLDEPWTGAVTGYRWFVPKNDSLPNLTLYSINSALAGLLGPGSHYVVWGGAWAIQRDVFEAIDIRNAWQGTLSDDLVAHRALREANLQVRFEPKCMVATPVDFDWSGALEFAQRQYRISRLYLKRWWILAVVTGTVTQAAFWGQIYFATFTASLAVWQRAILFASSVGLIAMTVWRAKMRQDLVDIYTPDNAEHLKSARTFDTLAAPLVALANLFVLFSSAVGRRIRWRGISYLVSPEGRSQLIGRKYDASGDEPVILKFPTPAERAAQQRPQTNAAGDKRRWRQAA
jgi:hypothetical protein